MLACAEKYSISRDDVAVGRILGEGFFGEVHDGVYKSPVSSSNVQKANNKICHERDATASARVMLKPLRSDACMCVCVCLQTGERIRVAIKTCKDSSADVKEKFLSEAGEHAAAALIISYRNTSTSRSMIQNASAKQDVHNRK